jgi:ATP-dependent DNA ligase
MRTECQDYEDSTYAQAVQSGYDTLQLKYDGWWSRTEIAHGEGRLYSKTGRLVTSFPANPSITGTFIGEYMFGTQWSQPADRQGKIYLHDVWRIGNSSLETFTYRDRYGILRANISLLGVPFEIVNNYPITAQPDIWQRYVATSLFEGVVYRRRLSPVDDTILREKAVVTEDVQVTGFIEGEGKHSGRLGALVCQNRQGVEIRVGGGLDDKAREDIWANQSAYLGRWCTIEGRARFASGAIRHPNFIAWRADLD